jgi:hypothetical protein
MDLCAGLRHQRRRRIAIVGLEQLGWSRSDVDAAPAHMGKGISTAAAADALAEERLKAR